MEGDLSQVSAYLTANSLANMDSIVKMEDLHQPLDPLDSMSPTPSLAIDPSALTDSPRKDAKQPKKRKSWGQVLPEPKTSLPPRKRAKTEDEKEQRRIERVKRNRLAAHNSRERKRQETENLQGQNDALAAQLHATQEQMQRMVAAMQSMAAELQSFRTMHGNNEPVAVPENIKIEAPVESYRSVGAPSSIGNTSPESLLQTIDSPSDITSLPPTPAGPSINDFAAVVESDQTQHSAAMLLDLQCPSDSTSRPLNSESRLSFLNTIAYLILLNIHLSSTIFPPALMALISKCLRSSTSTPSTTSRNRRASSTHRSILSALIIKALPSPSLPPTLALHMATSAASQLSEDAKLIQALRESNMCENINNRELFDAWCLRMTEVWIWRRLAKRKGNDVKITEVSELPRKLEAGSYHWS